MYGQKGQIWGRFLIVTASILWLFRGPSASCMLDFNAWNCFVIVSFQQVPPAGRRQKIQIRNEKRVIILLWNCGGFLLEISASDQEAVFKNSPKIRADLHAVLMSWRFVESNSLINWSRFCLPASPRSCGADGRVCLSPSTLIFHRRRHLMVIMGCFRGQSGSIQWQIAYQQW